MAATLGGMLRATSCPLDTGDRLSLVVLTACAPAVQSYAETAAEDDLHEVETIAQLRSWSWEVGDDAVRWSDGLYRLYGLAPQLVPITFESFVGMTPPEIREQVVRTITRCVETGDGYTFTTRTTHDGHAARWRYSRASTVTRGGRVSRMFGTTQDVTERILAEEALRESLEQADRLAQGNDVLRAEVEAVARVGSWKWEVEPDVVTFSDELFRLNGLLPRSVPVSFEMVARQYHPEDRSAQFELVDHCRRTGQPFENTHRIVRPDGTIRWRLARGQAVVVDGQTVRMYGTVQDITERVKREHALRRSLDESRRLAKENESLRREIEAQLDEVRESRSRIVQAGYETRRLLERDLHDGAQQRLTTRGLILRSAQAQLRGDASPALEEALRHALAELRAGLSELRAMARGLHPAILTDEGLVSALESLVARSPLPVKLSAGSVARLPTPIETTAYTVVAEALTKTIRHAHATNAQVSVEHRDGALIVAVSDDGAGGATVADGSGLRVLSDRVAALDGRMQIDSPAGGGTRLRAELPCA